VPLSVGGAAGSLSNAMWPGLRLVGWLEFNNVPFQHKYGYIRDEPGPILSGIVMSDRMWQIVLETKCCFLAKVASFLLVLIELSQLIGAVYCIFA